MPKSRISSEMIVYQRLCNCRIGLPLLLLLNCFLAYFLGDIYCYCDIIRWRPRPTSLLWFLQVSSHVVLDTSPVPAATDAVSLRVGCVMEIMTVVTIVMNRTAPVRFHSFFLFSKYSILLVRIWKHRWRRKNTPSCRSLVQFEFLR